MIPVTNGLRFAGKQMRLSVNYGPFAFIQDGPPDGITGPSYTRNADSTGLSNGPNSRLAERHYSICPIQTYGCRNGAFRDVTFTVKNAAPETLSVLPSDLTFTGSSTAQCGFGTASLFPTGGKSPYRAVATNSTILLSPSQVVAGDAFNLTVGASTTCITASVIVSDAEGKTATVTLKTEAGTTAPVLPMTANPSSMRVCRTQVPTKLQSHHFRRKHEQGHRRFVADLALRSIPRLEQGHSF